MRGFPLTIVLMSFVCYGLLDRTGQLRHLLPQWVDGLLNSGQTLGPLQQITQDKRW